MSQVDSCHALPHEIPHSALLQLLSNTLILSETAPYLPVTDILNLAATSRAFRYLIYDTPQVFRRLDLTPFKAAQFEIDAIDHGGETWRNVQMDENLTEDEFYSGPIRGIFSNLRRLNILRDVQVLVLDGLSVTADLIHDILIDPSCSVRILSLRGCKHLNERKLRAALTYACRASRPEGTPRLKGVYIFGKKDLPEPLPPPPDRLIGTTPAPARGAVGATWNARSQKALTTSCPLVDPEPEPEPWYGRRGHQFCGTPHPINSEWAQTLVACDGIVAFDTVLCTGPRHLNSRAWGKVDIEALNAAGSGSTTAVAHWGVAAYSLGGCAGCGSAPEGWTTWGEETQAEVDRRERRERRDSDGCCAVSGEIGRFPLLRNAPLHSANVKVAMCPSDQPLNPRWAIGGKAEKARFIPRCAACLRDRYCTACHRWWCESCYTGPFASHPGGGFVHNFGGANHGGGAASDPPGQNGSSATGNGDPKYKAWVAKSCWECGMNCHDCIGTTQRMCRNCGGGYCIIHNEGSSLFHCDCTNPPGRPELSKPARKTGLEYIHPVPC